MSSEAKFSFVGKLCLCMRKGRIGVVFLLWGVDECKLGYLGRFCCNYLWNERGIKSFRPGNYRPCHSKSSGLFLRGNKRQRRWITACFFPFLSVFPWLVWVSSKFRRHIKPQLSEGACVEVWCCFSSRESCGHLCWQLKSATPLCTAAWSRAETGQHDCLLKSNYSVISASSLATLAVSCPNSCPHHSQSPRPLV